ncbi:MAG: sugar phosphate isomerase/epimerase [Saprospiraceae bacterium]|nr:sugar phosphate isomerase/epimerase [Saprospiraceae bacterium]
MKIGMNLLLWTTDIGEHLYPIIDALREAGFDGVEVPIGDEGDQKYAALGKHIKSLGMGCTCVTSIFEDGNPASADAAVRKRAVEQMKWRIDMGQLLGAEVICGPYHSAFAWFSGEPPRDDERKYSAEVLRKAAEYASQADVVLTPEALNRFECYLYNTLDDIATLIHEVDHPNCKMIFDSHHAHIEEKDSAASIRKHRDIISHVHISESDRGTPGTGQVHWNEIFTALKDIEYDGWMTIEAFSRNKPEFASGINVWRNFADSMEEVYEKGLQFIRENT